MMMVVVMNCRLLYNTHLATTTQSIRTVEQLSKPFKSAYQLTEAVNAVIVNHLAYFQLPFTVVKWVNVIKARGPVVLW